MSKLSIAESLKELTKSNENKSLTDRSKLWNDIYEMIARFYIKGIECEDSDRANLTTEIEAIVKSEYTMRTFKERN